MPSCSSAGRARACGRSPSNDPSPCCPCSGRPLLAYVLERLAEAGVTRVIFGCGYLPDPIQACFGERASRASRSSTSSSRARWAPPAASAMRRAVASTARSSRSTATSSPMRRSRSSSRAHRERGAKATIALTPVADPSRYGLVRRPTATAACSASSRSPSPTQIDTDLINAGAYVLEPGGARPDRGRARRSRSSARRSPRSSATASSRCARPATGPTSARRRATSRPITTCSPAASARSCPASSAGGALDRRRRDASRPSAVLEAPCQSRRERSSPRERIVGAGSSVAADAEIEERAQLLGAVVQERAHVGEGARRRGRRSSGRARVIGAGAQIASARRRRAGRHRSAAGARVAAGERVFPEGARATEEGGR